MQQTAPSIPDSEIVRQQSTYQQYYNTYNSSTPQQDEELYNSLQPTEVPPVLKYTPNNNENISSIILFFGGFLLQYCWFACWWSYRKAQSDQARFFAKISWVCFWVFLGFLVMTSLFWSFYWVINDFLVN